MPVSRRAPSVIKQVRAPTGGLNARDSIAAMPIGDAITMDNMFPQLTQVELRRGIEAWATGITGPTETLMSWSGSTNILLVVASGGNVYNASATGAVGAPVATGLANSRLQYVNFSNTGNHYVVAVNGADGVMTFDGAAWATQVITGATASTFTNIASWKQRLWFVQGGTTDAWYLPTDAIAGAATRFQLGGVYRLGGTLSAVVTASFEANNTGLDDYIAFVSSLGEVALYRGTDPASAATFDLVGTFRIGRPVGARFFTQFAGDMVMITTDGVVSLLESIQTDRSQAAQKALSDKITQLFTAAYQEFGTNFGWDLIIYPKGHRIIVNVPQGGQPSIQYVLNTNNGSWCRFTGHDALCWAVVGDNLFFGGSAGTVYRADTGTTDDGAAIPYALRTAFNNFGTDRQKRFTMIRPLITANGPPNPTVALDVDYGTQQIVNVPLTTGGGALWDVDAIWDSSLWAGTAQIYRPWTTVGGLGNVASIRIEGMTKRLEMAVNAFDVVFEPARAIMP